MQLGRQCGEEPRGAGGIQKLVRAAEAAAGGAEDRVLARGTLPRIQEGDQGRPRRRRQGRVRFTVYPSFFWPHFCFCF